MLLDYLTSPSWYNPILTFMDQESIVFDVDSDGNEHHKEIHEKYKKMIDDLLANFRMQSQLHVREIKYAKEVILKHASKNPLGADIMGIFNMYDDCETFSLKMTERNIELQLEALEAIESKNDGMIPDSLLPKDHVTEQQHREAQELEMALELSRVEYEKEQRRTLDDSEEAPPPPQSDTVQPTAPSESPLPVEAAEPIAAPSMTTEQLSKKRDQRLEELGETIDSLRIEAEASQSVSVAAAAAVPTKESDPATLPPKPDKAEADDTPPPAVPTAIKAAPMQELSTEPLPDTGIGAGRGKLPSVDQVDKRREFLKAQREKLVARKAAKRREEIAASTSDNTAPRIRGQAALPQMKPNAAELADEKTREFRRQVAQKLREEIVDARK